ncbi:MAG: enoyl-CoA hydratase-related protein [Pseudomonadales bacterium]
MNVLTARELIPLTLEPSYADLDPGAHHWLAVDLTSHDDLEPSEQGAIARWLCKQTIPVVGLGRQESILHKAVDVIAANEDELAKLCACIERNPLASAVLVQVLRSTEGLDVASALTVESLAYATLQGGTEFGSWLSNREERVPQTPEDDNVVLLERAGPRLTITLNSPDNRNALSVPMRDALTSAFKLVAMDNSIERVDVHGNGPCFSAGGDLTEFGTLANPTDAHVIRLTRMPARYLEPCAGRYTFHLHAACIGAGIELPAFAGRLVATSDTIFQLPEVAMGLIPGAGGCVSIPRRIGRQRTAYMAILGERSSATDTLAWGLIDAIED